MKTMNLYHTQLGAWHILSSAPKPVNVTLFRKRVFADLIKDFKVRSSWIMRVDPKSNDEYP